jgi:dihydroorotate dehydrogenase (fumarate)
VPSASPLSESLDDIKRMEDAGASAIVLHSLFEEHITFERHQLHYHFAHGPEMSVQSVDPESYLDEIVAAKDATSIPIIASLNGSTLGGWTDYAKRIEEAGADALEINIYWIPTDPELTGVEVELRYKKIVSQVKATIGIPIAVKLSPFFSNIANIAKALAEAGADVILLCSVLLRDGIDHLSVIEREMEEWMEKHDYESVAQLKGSMSQKKCADPTGFERAQYISGVPTSWRTSNLP